MRTVHCTTAVIWIAVRVLLIFHHRVEGSPFTTESSAESSTTTEQMSVTSIVNRNQSHELGECESPILQRCSLRGTRVIARQKHNFTEGDVIEVVCDDGYRFSHIKSSVVHIVCQSDGSWLDVLGTRTTPSCERIGGCPLPFIANGLVIEKNGGYMPGDRALIQCRSGYSLTPRQMNPLIMCQKDGIWSTSDSPMLPTCEVSNCTPPQQIRYGGFHIIPPSSQSSSGLDIASNSDPPVQFASESKVVYYCNEGFKMVADDILVCRDGIWVGSLPHCHAKQPTDLCGPPPDIAHAQLYGKIPPDGSQVQRFYFDTETHIDKEFTTNSNGIKVLYICEKGYDLHGPSMITCDRGDWIGQGPSCVRGNVGCGAPPSIEHGDYNLFTHGGGSSVSGGGDSVVSADVRAVDGTQVLYFCHNGFRLLSSGNLTDSVACSNGEWRGKLPTCVKRTHCDVPMDIPNGNWIISSYYGDYRIGERIVYECEVGYKPIGTVDIECLANGYWSDYAPRCLARDEYCSEPVAPEDGFYMCKSSHCEFFKVSTQLHYMCNRNYEPRAGDSLVQTCLPGGQWSGERPVCLPVEAATTSFIPLNTSTVTVVVATSCGVLGLLVVVMLIVALKRHVKPRGRLCPPVLPVGSGGVPSGDPPGIGHDEHDRLALIAFADDNRGGVGGSVTHVPLPTYEEAMRASAHLSASMAAGGLGHYGGFGGDGSRTSSMRSSHSRNDYRPLPRHERSGVGNAALMRSSGGAVSGQGGGGLQGEQVDHHRNSIVTTASNATRGDNLSVAGGVFGSMDTVAASDATSTSVTVDTYDSMASNPSLTASQRAAAGSLESSSTHGSLASEAAPLLDPRDHRVGGSEGAAAGGGVIIFGDGGGIGGGGFNSDTLRSQTSRTHSESAAPIIEVPEDTKDD